MTSQYEGEGVLGQKDCGVYSMGGAWTLAHFHFQIVIDSSGRETEMEDTQMAKQAGYKVWSIAVSAVF